MQTIELEVEESFLHNFLELLKQYHDKVHIKDPKLLLDSYYYEHKQELEEILEGSLNGTREMLTFEELQKELAHQEKELEAKYANHF